jgi:hypothetical protein
LTLTHTIATWPSEFLRDAWNYFDSLVVLVSVLTPVLPSSMLPPAGSKALKMVRTLRVFRLIKRIPSMRKIVSALVKALPAMLNAFMIVVVLLSLYSIMGVRFFRSDPTYGADMFGNFFACIFTFWQITTGDDWSVIVRDLMANQLSNRDAILVACFFSTFQLLIAMCMINVVICVLVDGFDTEDNVVAAQDQAFRAAFRAHHKAYGCPLASLSAELVKAQDLEHLHDLVNFLYEHVGGGAPVCFEQLRTGLGSLPLTPPVILTPLHWVRFVKHEGLCLPPGSPAATLSSPQLGTCHRTVGAKDPGRMMHHASQMNVQNANAGESKREQGGTGGVGHGAAKASGTDTVGADSGSGLGRGSQGEAGLANEGQEEGFPPRSR